MYREEKRGRMLMKKKSEWGSGGDRFEIKSIRKGFCKQSKCTDLISRLVSTIDGNTWFNWSHTMPAQ